MSAMSDHQTPAKASLLYDPKVRGFVWQALLLLLVVFLIYEAVTNAIENLQKAKIASGLGFWDNIAGFDIGQRLIDYSAATGTYGRAFWVGLLNTLLVAIIGCFLATFLGFAMGIARLSSNFVVRTLSATYVEVIRNVPLLLQLLIWYNAVLKPLPNPRDSIGIPFINFGVPDALTFALGGVLALGGYYLARRSELWEASPLAKTMFRLGGWLLAIIGIIILLFRSGLVGHVGNVFALNNRGLYVPDPTWLPGSGIVFALFVLGIVGSLGFRHWARVQQAQTGQQYPVALAALISIIVIPTVAFLLLGRPVNFTYPQLQGFNLRGGIQIFPEFVALLVGLVTYTAAFIAEIVRAGIVSVSKGQSEAAHALGLRPGPTLKLVIIPQAMRVIIPPLTSNYLNLTKNSSLAVAVGYPDLVQVFMGTVLNQTGQAIEVIAITMLVYLTISLATATFMNWYNARKALVER